jgi:predicted DNA-binding transcriptional regulator AlpA
MLQAQQPMERMRTGRSLPETEFLPSADAAKWYGISQATIFRLLAEGELPRHRREGDRRTWLSVEELERLLRPRPTE